ncbi:MAG TPA: class I SAM-dependent methyltransferase [Polyangiaceae bacterium]|nr:class I SAM-dependent methyltransferase [Polyangiaceae bacterium]
MKDSELECVVCASVLRATRAESTRVRSNVRAFSHESFEVWRCRVCSSIHAREPVDLGRYYAEYPFHGLREDLRTRIVYAKQLARLRRAGLQRCHRVLDYGCGGGQFVRYLASRGYDSHGFDAYCPQYQSRSTLERQYDCVITQDVIEHVDSPNALLGVLRSLTRPAGILCVGTPNAEAIDLRRAHEFIHTLHAPYHRHILGREALVQRAELHGFQLRAFYRTMYTNTALFGLNEAFYRYYAGLLDDTLDAILGPIQVGPMLRRLPLTLFWGLFGGAFSRGTDCTAIFSRQDSGLTQSA